MQKDDSVPSAGTKADSSTGDQNMQSSSNDTKPIVVGLPSLSDETLSQKTLRQVREMMYAEPDWMNKREKMFSDTFRGLSVEFPLL
jgi:hypothetical protein